MAASAGDLEHRASRVLAGRKIIAEAWDAAGLYQVGYFPGYRWAEWNGQLPRRRPPLRQAATPAWSAPVATRIAGSADLYQASGPAAHQQHQLRHLPRRLHAQRPGLLQREAQRGQRRGQPRRHQRQLELELRRRGARPPTRPSRTCGGRQIQQLRRHPVALAGSAACSSPATRSGARSKATTTPIARTTRSIGSTGTLPEKHARIVRFTKLMIDFRKAHTRAAPGHVLRRHQERPRPARHHLARLCARPAGLVRSGLPRAGVHAGRGRATAPTST